MLWLIIRVLKSCVLCLLCQLHGLQTFFLLLFQPYQSSGEVSKRILSCSMSTLLFTRLATYISSILFKEINFCVHSLDWMVCLSEATHEKVVWWEEFTSKIPHSCVGVTKCGPEVKTEKHNPWDKTIVLLLVWIVKYRIGIKNSTFTSFTLKRDFQICLPYNILDKRKKAFMQHNCPKFRLLYCRIFITGDDVLGSKVHACF